MNNSCYYFEEINYESGFLDESVDVTYIIYLEGNIERLDNINNQLKKFHPTKKVIILHNKGYECKNQIRINNSRLDLIDCYITIFKYAKQNGYENILILEDDFIFSDEILSKEIILDLNIFLLNKKKENCIYLLGSLPFILIPYNGNHYLNILSLGCHSVVYTKKLRDEILSKNQDEIKDWDEEMMSKKRYTYYKTLCYQLFPETDNSKNWLNYFGHSTILKFILKKLELDKKIEPGYSRCLLFSKYILFIIVIIIIGIILVKIYK